MNITYLQLQDLETLIEVFTFPWSSPEETLAKWTAYLEEHKQGKRIVCLVRWQGKLVGYGSLLKESQYPQFHSRRIPEIHDVWVLESYRSQGLGTQLIRHLEELAQKESYTHVGIGVGLYKDYGSAQRLYMQLGYIPDGEGVSYQYKPTIPGSSYPLDDELVLWLTKPLPALVVAKEEGYYIERQDPPVAEDQQLLFDGISDDAAKKKGMERIKPFSVFVRDANQSILGGATGVTYYGCLYVDMLWVKESMRGHGLGKKVVEEAEKIGKERGCSFSTLNTMDWEALPFYQKLGYHIEFVREGYQKASKMYMLKKALSRH